MAGIPLIVAPPGAPFAWRGGVPILAAQFLADAQRLAARLPARGHMLNACADRYRFALGLAAAMLRNQVTLLPPDHAPRTVRRLCEFADDVYLLADTPEVAADLPRVEAADDPAPVDEHAVVPGIPPERLCAVVFTSGSTGVPVPNRKTWGALERSVRGALGLWGLAPSRPAILGTVPPQHMFGFESTVLAPLCGGGALCAERPFYPEDVAEALERLPRPRVLVSTPFHLRAMLEGASRVPPTDLLLCATAPLDPALARLAEARFGARLLEIYGCTETGQMASRRTSLEEAWRAFPGVTVELRADGRAWASGGHIEAPTPLGDVIEPLAPDRFLLRGRLADMVNIAGKRSSLAHLQAQLLAIEGVADGVFYMPADAPDGGVARLAAFVVAPGLTREAVLAALRERVDVAFLPRPLVLLARLPRAPSGKLPQDALRALALAHGVEASA
ncbi:MAG: AMP-binding protein [Burkholderiales bacterium]